MNSSIALLNKIKEASWAYYNTGEPIMDDAEYDKLVRDLEKIERETGIVYRNFVGAEIVDKINSVELTVPMLSLDKCHSTEELYKFAGLDDCIVSCKADGLSTRLIYDKGELIFASTRGDGYVGSDILFHVREFDNVPQNIPYKDRLVIDGESVILNDDFNNINDNLPDGVNKYKNSRNLASGTLAGHDSNVTHQRHMKFFAWRVIEGFGCHDYQSSKLKVAKQIGFSVVPWWKYNRSKGIEYLNNILNKVKQESKLIGLPIDGAVMAKDYIPLAESMGRTDKFFYHSIAYKYEDDTYETKLQSIEWSVGRTSITPVAIFDTVQIDGTDVNRASLHNISCIKELNITNGCTCHVYKANLIVPQIDSCEQDGNGDIDIPSKCPVCGSPTEIKQTDIAEVLVCTNMYCSGKMTAQFENFVSKRCLDIKGMSSATIDMLISQGVLTQFRDIYHLDDYYKDLIKVEGYGKKSIDKLIEAINDSRNTTLDKFICALGIDGVGPSTAKDISEYFEYDYDKWYNAAIDLFDWTRIDGIGDVVCNNICEYIDKNAEMIYALSKEFKFKLKEKNVDNKLSGIKFCITGKFSQSRDIYKKLLEDKGAKFVSSVSKNLDVLFVGDDAGGKLDKAQSCGVKIMYEKDLIDMLK